MRLIDADRITYTWVIDADGEEHDGITLQSIIKKMPTIDAVEVVFCKDCKWWRRIDDYDGVYGCCEHLKMITDKPIFVNEDFFCADGERREE